MATRCLVCLLLVAVLVQAVASREIESSNQGLLSGISSTLIGQKLTRPSFDIPGFKGSGFGRGLPRLSSALRGPELGVYDLQGLSLSGLIDPKIRVPSLGGRLPALTGPEFGIPLWSPTLSFTGVRGLGPGVPTLGGMSLPRLGSSISGDPTLGGLRFPTFKSPDLQIPGLIRPILPGLIGPELSVLGLEAAILGAELASPNLKVP